jgi:hypothetical protein
MSVEFSGRASPQFRHVAARAGAWFGTLAAAFAFPDFSMQKETNAAHQGVLVVLVLK